MCKELNYTVSIVVLAKDLRGLSMGSGCIMKLYTDKNSFLKTKVLQLKVQSDK